MTAIVWIIIGVVLVGACVVLGSCVKIDEIRVEVEE